MTRSGRAADYPFFDNGGLPIGFAHRGGTTSTEHTQENSLSAFRVAVELGYRYLETDVHATADGVLVAFHDPTLDRTTDGTGRIAELPYETVGRARIGGTEPIPLFADLLEAFPDARLNIDAKSVAAVPLLAAAVAEQGAADRVCVATFEMSTMRLIRETFPDEIPTSMPSREAAILRLLPGRALRRRLLADGVAAQVPVRHNGVEVVTASFVDRAHELGKQVHVWTIDAPEEINRLLDLGVDGIMTDRIDVLREVYRARGMWKG